MINYNKTFVDALRVVKSEGRYRVFADLERIQGRFPQAMFHDENGVREVTVWCSNDYLGMGQQPLVLDADESGGR